MLGKKGVGGGVTKKKKNTKSQKVFRFQWEAIRKTVKQSTGKVVNLGVGGKKQNFVRSVTK